MLFIMSGPQLDRITIDPDVFGGRPCIRGMRFRVQDVLEYMAGGDTEDTLLAAFPYIEREDVRAALAYAAREMERPATRAHAIAAE